jgi:nickel superoxide dismutase
MLSEHGKKGLVFCELVFQDMAIGGIMMKTTYCKAVFVGLLVVLTASYALAHCEIPCGIYDDELRIKLMAEHVTTMEKSINQIVTLSKQQPTNHNQLVRWVNNKEEHASAFQEIVTQYFMTQRIKFDAKDYTKKITVLHKMLVTAMKCKQTADLNHIQTLRALIKEFSQLYFKAGSK